VGKRGSANHPAGALAAALLAGCALSAHSTIADIKHHPGHYQHHSVTVDGVVTSSWDVPQVPVKVYHVDGGTGAVTVVSRHGHVLRRASASL
jgi:hypothetical protein